MDIDKLNALGIGPGSKGPEAALPPKDKPILHIEDAQIAAVNEAIAASLAKMGFLGGAQIIHVAPPSDITTRDDLVKEDYPKWALDIIDKYPNSVAGGPKFSMEDAKRPGVRQAMLQYLEEFGLEKRFREIMDDFMWLAIFDSSSLSDGLNAKFRALYEEKIKEAHDEVSKRVK